MRRFTWRLNLVALIVLMLGTSLIFQLFYVVPSIRNHEIETEQNHQAEVAQNIALSLENTLDQRVGDLVELTERPEFRNMDIVNQSSILKRFKELRALSSIFVLDAEGWFVSGSIDDITPYQSRSFTDSDFFSVPFERGEILFSSPRVYYGTHVAVTISMPIESDNGDTVGVITGGVWLNDFIEYVQDLSLDGGTVAYVIDRDGTVVSHSDIDLFTLEEGPLSFNYSDRECFQDFIEGVPSGSNEYTHGDTPHFAAWAVVDSVGWAVFTEVPIQTIVANSNVVAGQLLTLNVFLFIVALPASLFFTQQITAMQRQAEDDLKTYSERLEELVEERTRELSESEERFRGIAERSIDAIFTLDLEGTITYVSPAMKRVYGYAPEEIIGNNYHAFVSETELPRVLPEFMGVLNGETVEGLQIETKKKDGTPITVEISSSPIMLEEKIVGIQGIARDITERKRLAESVARRTSELLSLFETSPDIITIVDRDGNILNINRTAEPYTPEDVIGTNMFDIPGTSEEYRRAIDWVLDGKGQYSFENRWENVHTNENNWYDNRVAKIETEGINDRCMIISTDITDHRRIEAQFVRQEKLAVLGQLAGGVGHELRNPLGAIKNAVYFLNMVVEDPESEIKETLDILDREVSTSEKIISSILDFAQAKPPSLRKEDVNEIMQETLSTTSIPGNIRVETQLDERIPLILADPDQLSRAFSNVIHNAVQAMPHGGKLTIKSEITGTGVVALSIVDQGDGILPDNLDKIFEPLFTTKARGIGLGLAVTKSIVVGHGGTIEVESDVGEGSTFTITLPIDGG